MPEDLMRYDILAQQALRGVVRAALKSVERSGLPGEHHFYIAFDTSHPGTKVSDRLKRKYPEEMTIVLQHQFWGLDVGDDFALVPPDNPACPASYSIAGAVRLPGWHWQTKPTGFRSRTHRAAALVFADYPSVAKDFGRDAASQGTWTAAAR